MTKKECSKKLTKAKLAYKMYTGKDENPPEKKAVQKATEACTHVSKAIMSMIHQVFMLYSNLLMEEARCPWNKIHEE